MEKKARSLPEDWMEEKKRASSSLTCFPSKERKVGSKAGLFVLVFQPDSLAATVVEMPLLSWVCGCCEPWGMWEWSQAGLSNARDCWVYPHSCREIRSSFHEQFIQGLERHKSCRIIRLVASCPSAVTTLQDFSAKVKAHANYQSITGVSSNIELHLAPPFVGVWCH